MLDNPKFVDIENKEHTEILMNNNDENMNATNVEDKASLVVSEKATTTFQFALVNATYEIVPSRIETSGSLQLVSATNSQPRDVDHTIANMTTLEVTNKD